MLYLNFYVMLVLQEAFDDIALFFHDGLGGSVIGVLWKPNVLKPEPFKVSFNISLPRFACRVIKSFTEENTTAGSLG